MLLLNYLKDQNNSFSLNKTFFLRGVYFSVHQNTLKPSNFQRGPSREMHPSSESVLPAASCLALSRRTLPKLTSRLRLLVRVSSDTVTSSAMATCRHLLPPVALATDSEEAPTRREPKSSRTTWHNHVAPGAFRVHAAPSGEQWHLQEKKKIKFI